MTEEQERMSYKSFAEVKATLTQAEEKFERARNTVGLFLGPLVASMIYLIPMPTLTPQAHTLAAIIGWIVTGWVTEPVPISALFGAVLCVLFGVAPFADPVFFPLGLCIRFPLRLFRPRHCPSIELT